MVQLLNIFASVQEFVLSLMQVESTHLPVGGALTSLAHHIYTTVLLSQTKHQGI